MDLPDVYDNDGARNQLVHGLEQVVLDRTKPLRRAGILTAADVADAADNARTTSAQRHILRKHLTAELLLNATRINTARQREMTTH